VYDSARRSSGSPLIRMTTSGDVSFDFTIPMVFISHPAGKAIKEVLDSGDKVTLAKVTIAEEVGNSHQNLADFSSKGPTSWDHRFKPDIVCPGYHIRSASSDGIAGSNQCGASTSNSGSAVYEMSGTSMATPICAGAAAIVRQYYQEGWYPSGASTIFPSQDGFSPTAALVRCTMIHGSHAMRHLTSDGKTWKDNRVRAERFGPTYEYGYGLLDISTVLRFNDSSFNMHVVDNENIANGQLLTWCFNVTNSISNFRVSIAWTDPPGTPGVFAYTLSSDLDLSVLDSDGDWHYGNARFAKDETYSRRAYRDRNNNNEQVTLEEPSVGIVTVRVSGVDIAASAGQAFALVVTGSFDEGSIARDGQCNSSQVCPNGCTGNGVCATSGVCECDAKFQGPDCSLSVPLLQSGVPFIASVSMGD